MKVHRHLPVLVLAAAFAVLLVSSPSLRAHAGLASGSRAWEYKRLFRTREIGLSGMGLMQHVEVGEWSVSEDDRRIAVPNVDDKLAQLGAQGWELVSVTPRATVGGTMLSGMTSEELWMFKRPKP